MATDDLIEAAVSEPGAVERPLAWVWACLAAALSGGLMAACYHPLSLHFLAWFALVPWLWAVPRLSPAKTWLFGILMGLVFHRVGLAWLPAIGGPIGGITIVVLSVWMGFAFRVARLLMERFGEGAMLWAVPIAFAGQEILRCEGLPQLRFAFLGFGYSQSHNTWIAQIASLGGVYFLTGLVAAFNAALAYGLRQRTRRGWMLLTALLMLVVGLGLISQPRGDATGRSVTVACVQGEGLQYGEYLDLTRQAAWSLPKPDVIVLPEHTVTEYADLKHSFVADLAELARDRSLYICVGAHVAAPRDADCDYDNVAMLIGPAGEIVGVQAKGVPLPFFMDGNPARTQLTFKTGLGTIGMCVCYDATFTDIPRRLVGLGAEILVVPVMDAARWPAQELWQHADMAPIRSIEVRRSAVRAASSGISQIIDPAGRVVAVRDRQEGPGVIVATVPMCSGKTVFVRGGHLFAKLCGYAFLATVVLLTLALWIGGLRRFCGRRTCSPAEQVS